MTIETGGVEQERLWGQVVAQCDMDSRINQRVKNDLSYAALSNGVDKEDAVEIGVGNRQRQLRHQLLHGKLMDGNPARR